MFVSFDFIDIINTKNISNVQATCLCKKQWRHRWY